MKRDILKNFEKLTEKLVPETLFNKFVGLRPELCKPIKNETLARASSCEFCEIFKNTIFTKHLHGGRELSFENNMKIKLKLIFK